ncbi:unnamed protein product [Caenorhabditis nigoni]
MRKILISLSLLLIVNIKNADSAKNNPTNALHVIIEKFESLSRITNGLALQKELNSKSLKIDHLLAEILGIDPKNNGFEELRKFKMNDLSRRYAKFSTDAGGVKKSVIDEAMVKSQLDVLGKMGEYLEILKSGEPQNLDEIVENGKKVFKVDYSLFDEDFNDFPLALNSTFKLNKGNYKDEDFKGSFKKTAKKTVQFWTKVEKFINYEETFKALWAIDGSFSQLGSLRTLGKVADVYNTSYSNLTKLKDNIGTLNKDIPVLIPFIEKSSEIENLSKEFGKLYGIFGNFSTRSPSTRMLAAGLPRGTHDIERLFQDFNTHWFKKSIVNDNEKILKTMISDLNGLRTLNGEMAKTEAYWDNFKGKIDTVKVQKSFDLVEGASEHVVDINSLQTLQSSSSEVEGCLMDLTQISVNVDSKKLSQILEKLEDIEKAALKLKPLLIEFSKISVFQNQTIFDSLKSALDEIDQNLNVMLLQQEVDKLRANPDFNNFLEGSLEACKLVAKMRETEIIDLLLLKKIGNWDILTNTKVAMKDTNLIQTLECLQQKKFDATGISKLLTFGSMIRSIGDEYKKDKVMETFIEQMGQFQKSLRNLKSGVRPKRSPSNSTVDSLQNGLIVSQDLSKGVDLLRKMGNLYGKKKDLDMVVAGGREVFQDIQKLVTSVDSENLESEIKKTSDDLEILNSNAKKNPNPSLQAMGEFFENASTIHGVSIDSKLLADPVAISFEKSSNPKIQGSAVSLKTLGSLQLDFSNGRSDFKSAQLSISKLQEYFDQVFSIPRNSQNAESEPIDFVTYGIYGGSGLIFITVLIGSICLARWIVNDRKRSDPNCYIHITDSGEEAMVTAVTINQKTFDFLPIHQAVRDRNIDALKRCIMNGANVDAFIWLDDKHVTPLDMAVSQGEWRMARLLIMNGADRNLKNYNYMKPEECIHKSDHEMRKVFEELKGKTFRRRLPQQLPKSKFLIYGPFPDRWKSQKVNVREMATHMELFGEEHIDIDLLMIKDPASLKHLFRNVMIMKPSWAKSCEKWWHPWIPADYKHRMTKVKINGKLYETVVKIHQHSQERRISFLDGVIVSLLGFDGEDKISKGIRDALEAAISHLGADGVLIDTHANANDAFFTQVMTVKEFLEFIFKFEPHHYKLSGKEDKTTFMSWQPFNATN